VAALLAVATAGGCADEQEALIVSHSPGFDGYACVADPGSDVHLQRGTLDVSFGTPYTLAVVLTNNLVSRPNTTTNTGVENGELQLRDVDVVLSMSQSPEVIDAIAAQDPSFVEFSQTLASDSLRPGENSGVLVDVISSGASQALQGAISSILGPGSRPIITAELVFHATRTGNSTGSAGVIDARAYTFPIQLCAGCLPTSCDTCSMFQCPTDPVFVGPCGNAQDAVLVPDVCDLPQ